MTLDNYEDKILMTYGLSLVVNGFQTLTIITKCSILNVAAVLDLPLIIFKVSKLNLNLDYENPVNFCSRVSNWYSNYEIVQIQKINSSQIMKDFFGITTSKSI